MPTLFALTLLLALVRGADAGAEPQLAGPWFVEVSFPSGVPRTATAGLRPELPSASGLRTGDIQFHTFLLGERLDLIDAKVEGERIANPGSDRHGQEVRLSFRFESTSSNASFTGAITGNE